MMTAPSPGGWNPKRVVRAIPDRDGGQSRVGGRAQVERSTNRQSSVRRATSLGDRKAKAMEMKRWRDIAGTRLMGLLRNKADHDTVHRNADAAMPAPQPPLVASVHGRRAACARPAQGAPRPARMDSGLCPRRPGDRRCRYGRCGRRALTASFPSSARAFGADTGGKLAVRYCRPARMHGDTARARGTRPWGAVPISTAGCPA